MKTILLLASLLGSLAAGTALAASQPAPVKIGFVTTLSTPAGYLGEDIRDGFKLAIKQGNGTLGGVPVELVVQDDGNKPAKAKQAVNRLLRNGVQVFTGVVFGSSFNATAPDVLKADGFFISPNAGVEVYAGKKCHPNLFVASYEDTMFFSAGGIAANKLGFERVVIMAPDYQGGRAALNGFKSTYKGKVLAELYHPLDQSDFSVQLARISALKPDAIFEFEPGGLGINFIKQYANAGLDQSIPLLLPSPSLDTRMASAIDSAISNAYTTSIWPSNERTARFQQLFEDTYQRPLTEYAMEGYETALWIGSALKAVNGDLQQKDAFRAAMKKLDFDSMRDNLSLNKNHFPIEDIHLYRVGKNSNGQLELSAGEVIASGMKDSFYHQCEM